MAEDEELVRHEVTAWTVGDLRRALEGLPDHMVLRVHCAEEPGGDYAQHQVVTGAGFGIVRWGDERGEQVDDEFAIQCDFPAGDYYRPQRG